MDKLDDTMSAALLKDYHIPIKFLRYAKDIRERAHLEYEPLSGYWLLLIRRALKMPNSENFGTIPVAFVFNMQTLIVIRPNGDVDDVNVIQDIKNLLDQYNLHTLGMVLCAYLYQIANSFFDILDVIDNARSELEDLTHRPTNTSIERLTQLSKSLVYLNTASTNNMIAVEQLQLSTQDKDDHVQLTKREKEHLAEALIELKQANQTAQLSTDIMERVTDSYNNILNNNLNETMRFLTVWSIVLMIPSIISGFYGMNVKHLPLADQSFSWILTVVWSVLFTVVFIWHFHRHSN